MCKIEGRSREGRSKLSKVTDQKVSEAASGSLAPSIRLAWEEDDEVVQARLATMKLGTAPPCDLPARYCRCRSRVTQVTTRALKKEGEKRGTSRYKPPPFFFLFSDFSWWQWRGDECADPARSPTALQPHAFLTVPRPRPHCSDPARSPTALQPHALLTVPRPQPLSVVVEWRGTCADPALSPTALQPTASLTVPRSRSRRSTRPARLRILPL